MFLWRAADTAIWREISRPRGLVVAARVLLAA
jgi:hypothetical protein